MYFEGFYYSTMYTAKKYRGSRDRRQDSNEKAMRVTSQRDENSTLNPTKGYTRNENEHMTGRLWAG